MQPKAVMKKLGVKKVADFAKLLEVKPGTVYVWDHIPQKHMGKVQQLLADKANLPTVIEKKNQAVVFQKIEVAPKRPSKVAIAIMDADEAQEFLNNFMSKEVG